MPQQNSFKPGRTLSFQGYELDLEGCRLLRDGLDIQLEPRALDLLCYLAARPGVLVRKDELLWHVWHARTLSEGVLSNTIGKVRKALGQTVRDEGPIETVRGRGYRFRPVPQEPRSAVMSLPLVAAKEAPFVGRRAGLAQLDVALDAAADGRGHLLWIVGEAGVGKTRLLSQLASRASARGFSVWCGAGYDGAGT
ncbi:MAG TPA: BREX system ATP-binding domain-containing protein, partial [Polyangiales bacterium]|nr:BREX system ATP-binding domain-containing protein [Polyangiales bacterium]